MQYGLLTKASYNIGDEIQCLAALRFLPRIDYLIHRERIDAFQSSQKVSVILNHWWMWDKDHFPPSDAIDPLFVSFHLHYRLHTDRFMNRKVLAYLKAHEPIGCRSKSTAEYFLSKGIKAYFSGCLTTTLLPNPALKHRFLDDYILCVDVPDDVVQAIRVRTRRRVLCISRLQNVCFSYEQRMKLAKYTLFLYHNAHCVVTIALHAALPSTAFGTPVCVLRQDTPDAKTRFEGLEDCFHMLSAEEFLSSPAAYNLDNPPPNPTALFSLRAGLVETCRSFTGYDSGASIFENDYNPIAELAEMMSYSEDNVYKAMFFAKRKNLLKVAFRRCLLLQNRQDTIASRPYKRLRLFE